MIAIDLKNRTFSRNLRKYAAQHKIIVKLIKKTKMKYIFTSFNSFIHKPLLLAFTLLAMSSNAWGATLTAKVAVGSGKGSAKVEIIDGYGRKKSETTSTNSTVKTITFGMSFVNWGKSKFTATAADGYDFSGWYTNSACTSGQVNENPYTTAISKNKARTDQYWAKFTPHTYTIVFNNNGGSGTMATLDCTYDVNKTLTANSFTRTGYTFTGWNTAANGSGTSYTNGQSVNNLTTENGATVTLYAQWKANTYTVHFNGNGNSGGSTADQGFTYGTAQNLRVNGFTRAYNVTFDANGGTCATPSQTATYTFTGWAESATGAKKYNNSQNVNNLTATNGATVNLYAVWEGENITLPVATKEGKVLEGWFIGDEYVGAKNAIYAPTANVTLKAHWTDIAAPRYSWNGEESYLVGDEPLDLNELWVSANDESAKTFTLVSFVPSGINNSGAVAPALTGSTLTLGQAGEITVKVTQPATEYFYAGEQTRTITVNKHANTILVKGQEAYHSEIKVDSYDAGFTFTATNTNYSANPITVEQLTGHSVATYYPAEKIVYSASICGEATWQVTQPESYFYESATAVFAVYVMLEAEETCYVVDDNTEHKFSAGILDFAGHFDTPIAVSAPVKSLSFSAKKSAAGFNYFVAQYSTDNGNTWKDICMPNLSGSYQDFGPFNIPEHNVTHIRFGAKTGATLDKWYKNVKLARYTYLNLSEETLEFDQTADNKAIYPGEVSASKTFTIDWSMPNNGTEIQITTNNPDFHVSPAVINNTTCNNGSTVITVTYSSECAEVDEAKIRVGNQVFLKEIHVTGTTIKRDQAITWTQEQNLLTTDNLVLAAIASSNLDIEYSIVEGENVATVNPVTGEVTILKNGDVTFRASQAGDGLYNAAEPVDRVFHISLTPSALAMNDGSVVVSMPGSEYELDLSTLIESQTGNGAITYAVISNNAATATIAANMFKAEAVGDYTIRATKAQTNYYAMTTDEFVVTVIEGAIYTGDNLVWDDSDNWSNGVMPETTDRVIINADVEVHVTATVAGLTINEGKTVTIKNGGKLIVGDGNSLNRTTYGNIIVEAGGQLLLNEGNVEINDFTLYSTFEAGAPKSGQISGAAKLNNHGHAYFIIDLDPAGNASAGWYDFTVPFPVNALTGITRSADGETWNTIVNERNYAIMDFHEDLRAQGLYAWKKYRGILQPGVAYTMTIDSRINKYRFEMAPNGAFNTATTQPLQSTNSSEDAGWNGVGNGTMSYITLRGTPVVQMYNHAANAYNATSSASQAFAVGAAYFVQRSNALSELTMDAAYNATSILRAPQREQEKYSEQLTLTLSQNGLTRDNLFVTCSENATDTYTRGFDVQKLGELTAAKVARIWTNTKGKDLCAVYAPYNANEAIIPLQFFAPEQGEYTLSIDRNTEEDIYLTRNGVIIWDMNMSDYNFTLEQGTDNSYALQVIRSTQNVATGAEQLSNDAQRGADFVEKMIVNGQLFILRDGNLYDAQGKKVTAIQ